MMKFQSTHSRGFRERRRHPRYPMPPAATELHVRRDGRRRFDLTGRVHDISAGGVRFELDGPLDPAEEVDVRVVLPARPGVPRRAIRARGRVVRLIDPEGADAAQIAMAFTQVRVPRDPHTLACYIQEAAARRPTGGVSD